MKYEWFIGLRYLKAKRKQTFISIITFISIAGIALGVAAMIVVLSVFTGFEKTLKEKIVGMQPQLILLKPGYPGVDRYPELVKEIEKVKDVVSAAPFILNQVMLFSESTVLGVEIKGIDPDQEGKVTDLVRNMKEGRLQDLKETGKDNLPGIILGTELAKHFGVSINDSIQVVSPLGNMTPMGMMPKTKHFRVAGIFYSGMYQFDSTFAYISLGSAQKFFNMDSRVTGIEIKTNDIYRVKETGKAVREHLGFPFWTRDWMEMNRNLFSAMKMEKIMMFIITAMIIVVAAFNTISTLIMVVMEKHKDIAVLKSMGAPSAGILKIFIIEGLVIGMVGTLLGMISGLVLVWNLDHIQALVEKLLGFKLLASDVYYIDKFPSYVDPFIVGLIVVTAILVSFLATIYPSWRASRLDPAEALRYE